MAIVRAITLSSFPQFRNPSEGRSVRPHPQRTGISGTLEKFFEFGQDREHIPLTTLRNPRPESILTQYPLLIEDIDRHLYDD